MQGDNGAPLGCLSSSTFQYNDEDARNNVIRVQALPGLNEIYNQQSATRQSHSRPVYQQNFSMQSASHLFQELQQDQSDIIEKHFYQMPDECRIQYLPFWTSSPGYLQEFQSQEFQYFVVIDFEATCDKDKIPHPQEIIEFPAVLVNGTTGQLEASFQTYVRPAYHQVLTDFCKDLTGIQQIQVDQGVPLCKALLMHDKWLEDEGITNTNFSVVTWSSWDCRVMLESECRLKRIRRPPYFNRWINLKVPFQQMFGGVRCNLKQAVELAGLEWEGRAHCGLDDARNTARLLTTIMRRGFRLSITDSLVQQPSDRPVITCQQPQPVERPGEQVPVPAGCVPFYPSSSPDPARTYCYCGAESNKRMIRKPGPKQGCTFFGCGNWTATRGALCPYFEWAT